MQTRRYSSVLAVYHRVGGGRAIPATRTRSTGPRMGRGQVSGRADMRPPTAGYGPPDTANPERGNSGADFSGVLAALRVRARRGTRTHVGRILTAALTGVRTRGVYRCPYRGPYSTPYSDPYSDQYGGAGARRRGSGPFTAHKVGLVGRGHTPAGVRRGCATAPGSRQDSEKPPQSVSKAV